LDLEVEVRAERKGLIQQHLTGPLAMGDAAALRAEAADVRAMDVRGK
jgi:hypothetical protein